MNQLLALFRCWWSGHDPILRDDMRRVTPFRSWIDQDAHFICHGATFWFGLTKCACCGCLMKVEGGRYASKVVTSPQSTPPSTT